MMDLCVCNAACFKLDCSFDPPRLKSISFAEFNHLDALHPEWIHIRDFDNHVHLVYEDDICGSAVLQLIDLDLNFDIPVVTKGGIL